jgi:hypothetical protein
VAALVTASLGKRPGLGAGDRVIMSLFLGGWGAFITYFSMVSHPQHFAKDLSYPWRAARALLDGHDPYQVIQGLGAYPFNAPLFYPLPAALVVMPVTWWRPEVGGAVFIGISSSLLAFALLRESPQRLWVFASAPFVHAAILGQWAPLLTAAALMPTLQFAAAAKPTVGLVAWLYRPSWRGIAGGLVLLVISLVLLPSWPTSWLEATASTARYRGPATTLLGCFLLLGLLRWRRKEGRLIVSLALVPQLPVFYDALPLWLIPSTWLRSLLLSASSWIAYLLWYPFHKSPLQNETAIPLALLFIWAPALILVLLLPNTTDSKTGDDAWPRFLAPLSRIRRKSPPV